LVAVTNKHLAVVSFIMEKMKIGLRQALCLEPVDDEENFMNDVNEDYQVYAVLVACFNKDEPMLRYLWESKGDYLWTDRHFEPVMRYLIESGWCDGIRILMRSQVTHNIVKTLSSDERSYFVDNIIGDPKNIVDQEVVVTLKDELCL